MLKLTKLEELGFTEEEKHLNDEADVGYQTEDSSNQT